MRLISPAWAGSRLRRACRNVVLPDSFFPTRHVASGSISAGFEWVMFW